MKAYLDGFAAVPGPNQYECAMCGGIFNKSQTDEEADEECVKFFPGNDEPREVVCDDCFKKMGLEP